MEVINETAEQYQQRKQQIAQLFDNEGTLPPENNHAPELSLPRKQRRIQQAAYQREQKKIKKSLLNVPDWLK